MREFMSEYIEANKAKVLLQMDATEIAELIKTEQLTSEEITRTLINHITLVNPSLNAVVEDRFADALDEAILMDKQLHNPENRNKSLYGVPISIKESLNVNGMKTTGGVAHRKDIIMSKDADVVKILKESGAIILCKTNTPALCFCHETDNKLYGRTNNAWDIERTAGGSSGGEAALISVGGSPLGMSSDIGGSIRFPSHFNGVVGFKPGAHQVSSEGHFPPDTILLQTRMSSIGPIGKSVRDVELIYHLTEDNPKKKSLFEKMQIEILPFDNGYPLSNSTVNVYEEIFSFVQEEYETARTIPPYFNDSALLWQEIMSVDGGKHIKRLAFNTDRPNVWKQYMKEKVSKNTMTHIYLSWALIGSNLFKPSTKRVKEMKQFLDEGDRVLSSYLQNRLLIFPVYHRAANKHGELFREIFSINKTYLKYMPYVAYANVWGLPSLTIPVGFDNNEMPIGIQIMSKTGNEDAIFRLGKLLEKKFGGYKRSTIYD